MGEPLTVWIGEYWACDGGGFRDVFATREIALAWLRERRDEELSDAQRQIAFEASLGRACRNDWTVGEIEPSDDGGHGFRMQGEGYMVFPREVRTSIVATEKER